MKIEAVICDECKDKISKMKCDFCDKDVCGKCVRDVNIQLWRQNTLVTRTTSLNFCKSCFKEKDLTNLQKETILYLTDEVKKIFIEGLKKKRVISNLK